MHRLAVTHHIKWYPPRAPYIKLNIDGAFTSSNKYGGAGGIFKDSDGKWLLETFIAYQATKLNSWPSKKRIRIGKHSQNKGPEN